MKDKKSQDEPKVRKVRPIHPTQAASILNPSLQHAVKNMNHRDMQKKAILLGMKPRNVVGSDHWVLLSYLDENWGQKQNKELLFKFDKWLDRKLIRLGKESIAPSLRMSFVRDANIENMESAPKKEIKKKEPTKTRKPRVKSAYGIVEGTKKHYVYELTKKGKTTDKIVKAVIKKYPESKENSIKIWIGKAKKCFKDLA